MHIHSWIRIIILSLFVLWNISAQLQAENATEFSKNAETFLQETDLTPPIILSFTLKFNDGEQVREELILPQPLLEYLKQNFPGYRIPGLEDRKLSKAWNNYGFAGTLPPVQAIGDFNGDGQKDIALLLMAPNYSGKAISFHLLAKNKIEHFIIMESDRILQQGISLSEPGDFMIKIEGEKEAQTTTFKNPGIRFWFSEASFIRFYWQEDTYEKINILGPTQSEFTIPESSAKISGNP